MVRFHQDIKLLIKICVYNVRKCVTILTILFYHTQSTLLFSSSSSVEPLIIIVMEASFYVLLLLVSPSPLLFMSLNLLRSDMTFSSVPTLFL